MIKFVNFSPKQMTILSWWTKESKLKDKKGIIADGSIRSGKTLPMSISFVLWVMSTFNEQQLGMSGKSIDSFKRNVLFWLIPILKARGFKVSVKDNLMTVKGKDKVTKTKIVNYFYIFGGRDERSQDFIQGMTAAGWFFDEVAIQPESFVNQAIGRCSAKGSKLWFNCNPDKPSHWFKKEFIDKHKKIGLVYLHFLMEDNPSLDKEVIEDYKSRFSGVFYLRFILGLWVLAAGVIFDMINEDNYYDSIDDNTKLNATRYISVDYGITNPMSFGNFYDAWDVIYQDDEYYYDCKEKGKQQTDTEFLRDLKMFIAKEPYPVEAIVIDPSASSFKVLLRNEGYRVKEADNDVMEGIKIMGSALYQKKLKINNRCKNFKDEIGGYCWDSKALDRGIERPIKVKDHSMDMTRYMINTIAQKRILGRV